MIVQKQPPDVFYEKRCSQKILRIPFLQNTSERLLLKEVQFIKKLTMKLSRKKALLVKICQLINSLNAEVAIIETSQLVCSPNQLTGFYMMVTLRLMSSIPAEIIRKRLVF